MWTIEHLSQARGEFSATTAAGEAFFAGGNDASGTPFDVVDIYHAATGTWRQETLSAPRGFLGATSVRSKAMIAGGWVPPNETFCVVDVFLGSP